MGDMLAKAADWLARVQRDHASQSVYYTRASASVRVRATLGRSVFDTTDAEGFALRSNTVDFIFETDELAFDGEPVTPAPGTDRIVVGETDDGRAYEVRPAPDDKCFRFVDEHRRQIRVHAVYVGTQPVAPD